MIPERIKFTAFEPILCNQWIVEWDGIPSHLFKSVSRFVRNDGIWENISIQLHNVICPSTAQAIDQEIMKKLDIDSEEPVKFILEVFGPAYDSVQKWEVMGFVSCIIFPEKTYESSESLPIGIDIIPLKIDLIY